MNVKKIKDKLYYYFAEKNWGVRREYGPYVDAHQEEHVKQPWKHWWLLIRLNWHYRILRRTSYYTNQSGSSVSKVKLPYLEGSESQAFARRRDIWFAKDLAAYDIVSFDIFDTLVLRPFARPVDLFIILGKKFSIMNFQSIREQAERDARAEKRAISGTNEVTIYDIYEKVSKKTGLDLEFGVKTEFETEMEFCFANPYMLRVFKMLRDQGKRIIITSDMYFPQELMERLLSSCGYKEYEKLYISCEHYCSKRSGGLYKNLLRDYAGMRIAHVGDNFESDVKCAEAVGLHPFFYKNCHEIGNPYRADGMSSLIGPFYAGLVNTHLHNGIKTYSPYYEFGFIYGGLYILGYCNWIYRKAKQDQVDKVMFLSRDGYIYQQVFKMLFDDMPNEYVYWSRIANTRATIEINRSEFLRRVLSNKAHVPIPCSLGEVFRAISLDFLLNKLEDIGLREEDLLIPEIVPMIENLCIDHWDEIVAQCEKETEPLRQYFSGVISDCKKVAVVDIGWVGSGPLGIKYLLEKKWKMDCRVKCYLAASFHFDLTYNVNEIMDDDMDAYIFSQMFNRNLYDVHRSSNKGMNNAFFELFSQANHPSFAGITTDGNFEFDVAEVSNYKINTEIHRGILDFCSRYIETAKRMPSLMHIEGYDVYLPFRMLIRNLKFMKKMFGGYTISLEIANYARTQTQETLGDAMKQRKLM